MMAKLTLEQRVKELEKQVDLIYKILAEQTYYEPTNEKSTSRRNVRKTIRNS